MKKFNKSLALLLGSVMSVSMLGSFVACGDKEKGENEIEIVLTVGNRNLLGPFHTMEQENFSVGPFTWERSGLWKDGKCEYVQDTYALVKTLV